eukprot:UN07074
MVLFKDFLRIFWYFVRSISGIFYFTNSLKIYCPNTHEYIWII